MELKLYMNSLTSRRVIKEKTEILSEKSLPDPLSRNDPLVNKLKYNDTKKTFKV